jgi:hypothetical protein
MSKHEKLKDLLLSIGEHCAIRLLDGGKLEALHYYLLAAATYTNDEGELFITLMECVELSQ